MIKTEFVEDAHDYAADLVAAAAGWSNRPDEKVERLFVVASIQRGKGPAEIRHSRLLERDPGSQSRGRKAAVHSSEDLEGLVLLPAAGENPRELDGSSGVARLELQGGAEGLLVALLSQQFRLRR